MKKPLTGVLIILFCLFGMVGIAQNKELKQPAPVYVVLVIGALFGVLVVARGRRKAGKHAAGHPSAARTEPEAARSSAASIYLVKVPHNREYRVPKVCCSCLGNADGMWPATWRSAGMRHSVDIPFCRKCGKTKYPWWKHREPISCVVDLKSDRVVFGFDNLSYAREFALLNGGSDPEVYP